MKYIYSIKNEINQTTIFLKRYDLYKENKHGKIWFIEDYPKDITRKKLNWYLRNYSNVYFFIH